MELARLILDYIEVLMWPVVIGGLALALRRPIIEFVRLFLQDAEEVEAGILGVTAKIRRNIGALVVESDDTEIKSQISRELEESVISDVRVFSLQFHSRHLNTRVQTAKTIEELAAELTIDQVFELGQSPLFGERVSAGIALGIKIKNDRTLRTEPRVRDAISAGLKDRESKVRYRFAGALKSEGPLIAEFHSELAGLAANDNNPPVRRMAAEVLASRSGVE